MVMVGSGCRPKLRSPAGHREGREVGDDMRGQAVSERGRESERARAEAGRVAGPRGWADRERGRARGCVGRSVGPDQRERRESARFGFGFCFSFSKL
jgi:hypothetical protein